ncbi:MAG: hypothetical protein OHK0050_11720 [Roseiflexaceae bacterium]
MLIVSNPFVDYLSRYTTASPDHEAAFDEFLAQAAPPAAGPLRLSTKVEAFLHELFQQQRPPSVILTGNAGDGKTYLCRQIVAAFQGYPLDDWNDLQDRPLERDGIQLHVVKDLSELSETQGISILHGVAAAQQPESNQRYFIAANEGRLRALLSRSNALHTLNHLVDRQLREGPDPQAACVVINLTKVSTSTFVPATLAWMTNPIHWQACHTCPLMRACPIQQNAARLRDPAVAARVQLLYQILEQLDQHMTMRDMLIHLAYTITGDQQCAQLQQTPSADYHQLAYYVNIWGGQPESSFRRKASVVQHLARLRIGDHSFFKIDEFIVSGGESPAEQQEHASLFAPAVDLNQRQFGQDREAYLQGGADQAAYQEGQALHQWLPHCRRKLFFEWQHHERIIRLIPFLHLQEYHRLLTTEQGASDILLRKIILGLNRAFSRLYLNQNQYLYVTTQYLRSGEQPRPLVRLRFPETDLSLEIRDLHTAAYDCDHRAIYLLIAPPAHQRISGTNQQPLHWRIGLLQFEYLLRLAEGGTFNILAQECELEIRNLKDHLLSSFPAPPDKQGQLEFFVADREQYQLRQLRIDPNSNIIQG